ncbi:uncharacterized protein JCM6883_003340 [Sporobolomyces salmoneus]|uniref:uncharacterized protein n=1 Tax=Sporobolomyces salmoneus TaxID=183962 RepID=UPI00316F5F51
MGLRDSLAACTGFSNKRPFDPEHDLPDLSGKVAVVTGGNTGLGEQTALNLHSKNAKVYIACRSEERALEAIKRINSRSKGKEDSLIYLPFDLTDLKAIKTAAETIKGKEERLDIVVCNAGVMAWPYKLINGVEVQLWNHLGHFAFIHYLEPLLLKTARSNPPSTSVRVVNLSSLGHKMMNKPDFSSMDAANQTYGSTWKRYGQAKLACILDAVERQERWKGENIAVNSAHPGVINTELARGPAASYGAIAKWAFKIQGKFLMTIPEGAKTSTYLAASREVDEHNYRGKYFTPIATETSPSKAARDPELAKQLWKISEEFLAKNDPKL